MDHAGNSPIAPGLPYHIRSWYEGESMTPMPCYEIFQKVFRKPPVWMETVVGLEHAKSRLKELAQGRPGSYFILDCENACLIVPLDANRNSMIDSSMRRSQQNQLSGSN